MPDFATPIVDGISGAVGGGIQRLVWEKSERNGWIVTGAMIIGGVVGAMYFRQPLIQQVAKALTISGATVAGWVVTEMNLIKPVSLAGLDEATWSARNLTASGRPRIGHLPAYAGNGVMANAHVLTGDDIMMTTDI